LNQAFSILRQGYPLVAMHKAKYFAREDGLALGPGPFVTALEYATGTQAKIIGKPEPTFFSMALKQL
jgi:ribonucleotide monophosphatase NagD (HAD superfamily)